jgi:ketosteroid isomerase-like protein
VSEARDITPALEPAESVLARLGDDATPATRLVVQWFAALSKGRTAEAWAMLNPTGSYFLLRQRKTISLEDFSKIMDGLVGATFTDPIHWSLGTITAQDDRVALVAGSYVPLVNGGTYENLYHFLFRVKDGLIQEGYEFADTFRSAQTFAAPPGERGKEG